MERNNLHVLLSDLRGKFELVLEDYAALQAELLALRRKTHEQHELTTFLLGAIAADLAAHRADTSAHPDCRANATGRLFSRPPRPACSCPPS
jgi:hypothetical protein